MKHRPFAECSPVSKFIALCFSLSAIELARHAAEVDGRKSDFGTLSDALWMRSSVMSITDMERQAAINPAWPFDAAAQPEGEARDANR